MEHVQKDRWIRRHNSDLDQIPPELEYVGRCMPGVLARVGRGISYHRSVLSLVCA